MGIALTVNAEPGIVSNLVDITTDRQRRILRYGPTLYLTPETMFMQNDGAGKLAKWHDATGAGYFSPAYASLGIFDQGEGLSALGFEETAGQALVDSLNLDRLPPNGTPCTIAMLVRQASGAGNFGGGIMGSRTAGYGSQMLALYIDRTGGTPSLQTQFGVSGKDLYSSVTVANDSWHLVIMTWKGSSGGAQVIQDGSAQALDTDTLTLSNDPNARKVLIGDYGPIGTDMLKGGLAGLAIFPTYVGESQNAPLLADLLAEWGWFRTSLNT